MGALTLSLGPGERCALVGPNGSGKSTILLALLGLLPFTHGRILIHGESVGPSSPPRSVGALLTWPGFYPWISGRDNLRLVADGQRRALERVDDLLDEVGLGETHRKPVAEYSTGMLKRLELARALLFDPGLLVLDEPTNGLDEAGWTWLRDKLLARSEMGCGILLATHDGELVGDLAARRVPVANGVVGELRE